MAKEKKVAGAGSRPEARLPKGFRDIGAAELAQTRAMLDTIRGVYESYGFEQLETPAIEYTDALGKFLPDQDRPNEGVFSFTDDDGQWLSLRYDLTAPLARYVAENFQTLPKPFRRYATGTVYRNEKPGPGRFRQFTQFDADTVGTDNLAADAEICMLAADTLEALGIKRGDYVIKVNNRKVLDGVIEAIGLVGQENAGRRLTVLRAIDKLDKFGPEDVRLLLGDGRKDESGDFTKGAGLSPNQVATLMEFIERASESAALMRSAARSGDIFNNDVDQGYFVLREGGSFYQSQLCIDGHQELETIRGLLRGAGYGMNQIIIDYSVVRGLEYYTGPVFEAELTFEVKDEKGNPVRFGSVGGGGRYDGLVERFLGQKVPATGFSIGVSRLQAALNVLNAADASAPLGPVVVLVMDKGELPRYQRMAQELRRAGIRAEMYLGTSGMKAQMKYADKRGAPCVIIQGSDERDKGEVQLKDLIEGAKAAAAIADNKEWKESRPAQVSIKETDLVAGVREILARHGVTS
ncbi:MAG: histidine--tRNA ligase [Hyphomicrobiaceae bacterium]|nr:histidine--tRNA ligase [Hyphomicrobiaceae bacterium]